MIVNWILRLHLPLWLSLIYYYWYTDTKPPGLKALAAVTHFKHVVAQFELANSHFISNKCGAAVWSLLALCIMTQQVGIKYNCGRGIRYLNRDLNSFLQP